MIIVCNLKSINASLQGLNTWKIYIVGAGIYHMLAAKYGSSCHICKTNRNGNALLYHNIKDKIMAERINKIAKGKVGHTFFQKDNWRVALSNCFFPKNQNLWGNFYL